MCIYLNVFLIYELQKSLLIPKLVGPACSLLVNILLWPEHATTNYIPYLHETLQSFIDLLDQETHFFLRDTYNRNTIAKLHRTVQDNLANLDIAKREAQHEGLRRPRPALSHLGRPARRTDGRELARGSYRPI